MGVLLLVKSCQVGILSAFTGGVHGAPVLRYGTVHAFDDLIDI